MVATVEGQQQVDVPRLGYLHGLIGLVAVLVALVLPIVVGGIAGVIDDGIHRAGFDEARGSLLDVVDGAVAVGEPVAMILVLILDTVEHIVHRGNLPLRLIGAHGFAFLLEHAGEDAAEACLTGHHQGDDVGVLHRLRVVEEGIGELYLGTAVHGAFEVERGGLQLIVALGHHLDGAAVGKGESGDQCGIDSYLNATVGAVVGTSEGGHDLALVGLVERGVVLVVAKDDGAHGILIGEVDGGASLVVGELLVAILAGGQAGGHSAESQACK